jgi:sortase (surface protein transpeptidase)
VPAKSSPATIEIPAIKVKAPLVPLGLNLDKTVRVPDLEHANEASWYCVGYEEIRGTPTCSGGGVIPGNVGPAAIYGHIDAHQRDGVFRHLPELNIGDTVNIKRADGTALMFKVYKVQQVPKSVFPSAQVYGNVTRPELRLITCTGAFVGGQVGYHDQGIVYASLA